MTYSLQEPNPAPGRELRPSFFNDRTKYFEDLVAASVSNSGLLGKANSGMRSLVALEPSDLLRLRSIAAIGEQGYLIFAESPEIIGQVKPFDTRALAIGTHQIYACLALTKVPCGDPVEVTAAENGRRHSSAHRYLKNRIVLEAGQDRLKHRDWIQVAEITKASRGGVVGVVLNERFHPPVTNMSAYYHQNPLRRLAELGLTSISARTDEHEWRQLRIELALLRNIASSCSPEQAYIEGQRCLMLLSCYPELLNLPVSHLLDIPYEHSQFCEFLASLADCLENYRPDGELPESLEVDGRRYFRLPGELRQEGDVWSWAPPEASFNTNSILIYMPRVAPGSVPNIHYGSERSEQGRSIGSFATKLSGAGTAIKLDRLSGRIKNVVIAVDRLEFQQRLVMQLGEGHALYYC